MDELRETIMQPLDMNLIGSSPLKSDPLSDQKKESKNKIYRLIAKTIIARMGASETAKAYEMAKSSDPIFQKTVHRSKIIAESSNALKINLPDDVKEKLIRKIVRRLKKIEVIETSLRKTFKITDPYLVKPIADALEKMHIKWADYHFPESYKISLWKNKGELILLESINDLVINKIVIMPSPKT